MPTLNYKVQEPDGSYSWKKLPTGHTINNTDAVNFEENNAEFITAITESSSDKSTFTISKMKTPVYVKTGSVEPDEYENLPSECLIYIKTSTQE